MNCINEYVKGKCFSCGKKSEAKYCEGCEPCYCGICKGGTVPVMVMTDNGMIYMDKQDLTEALRTIPSLNYIGSANTYSPTGIYRERKLK